RDRIRATYGFVKDICEYAAANKDAINKLLDDSRKAPKVGDKIALRYQSAPVGRPHELLGYVEEMKEGKRVRTDTPRSYEVQYTGGTETTLTVPCPDAYLFPASLSKVTELLQRHGLVVEELREDIELDVEAYHVDKIGSNPSTGFTKHRLVLLDATARKESRR